MEILSFLLLIVILIIIITQNSKVSQRLQRLEQELRLLRKQFSNPTEQKKEYSKPVESEIVPPAPEPTPYKSLFTIAEDQPPIPESTVTNRPIESQPKLTETQKIITIVEAAETISTPPQKQYKAPPPTFFERNPDMEKFIGENLISKIGIAVLVLAIGFFVKYAIDKNWIGPVARVAVGILCGTILVSLAHRFRNTYRAFSSVLAGGGIAVFYFTITLAFQQFHLFNQAAAFTIMIVTTVFAVVLSILYDKQELAVIALIGGFLAPFLVSTGESNYKVLFTYLAILNTGLLVIAYYKIWRILNLLNFIFTILIFGTWLIDLKNNETVLVFKTGFLFATIFYLQFLVANIAYNIKEKKKFIALDFSILLINTALYFAAGIYCLNKMNSVEYRGLFSASMGVFNLVISFFLFRKQKVDTNILYLLTGITLTFISLSAPIQLHGNYITLFWASEAVLLYWLFTKSRLSIIQYGAGLVWIAMLASLLIDWVKYYAFSNELLPVIMNRAFITSLFCAVSTYLLFLIRRKEGESIKSISSALIPGPITFRICAVSLAFISGAFEITHQFVTHYPNIHISILYFLLYTLAFVTILLAVTQRIKQLRLGLSLNIIFLAVCIVLFLLCTTETFLIQRQMLQENRYDAHFFAHWISALLVAGIIYRLIKLVRDNRFTAKEGMGFIAWVFCAIIVIFLSSEVHLLSNRFFYTVPDSLEEIKHNYIKAGLPILWGLCSFFFMWLGMRHKYRTLRIISLSLFSLTLIKLFVFDIRNIPAGGKIAAFFCLGILLLVVSFMYQRLKKIIISDEEKMD